MSEKLGNSDKVKVAVRLRPLNKREIEMGTQVVVDMENNQTILYPVPPLQRNAAKGCDQRRRSMCEDESRNSVKTFAFDHCFWSVDPKNPKFASQETVFKCLGVDVMENAFRGYNACIFAYGQTGSGKSYSMMGSHDAKGIIPRLCDALFDKISSLPNKNFSTSCKVEVSFMEIYNEKVHDLLDVQGHRKHLRVREHSILGPYVDGLSQLVVTCYEDIDKLMSEGNKSRTVAATNMNSESSRSHAVFNIKLTQTLTDPNTKVSGEKVSKMSLVDLAGSERAQKTGAVGERLREGCNINRSLTTLMQVISALADSSTASASSKSSSKTGDNKSAQRFVPYRDSVLTWLLKDNLGGNSKTVMIATLSPAADNYEETLSTVRYADRAKRIVNHAKVNEDPNSKIIIELRDEVDRLRQELATAKERQTPKLKEKLEESEKLVKELTKTWEEKLQETERIHKERHEALEKMGISVQTSGIKVEKNKFYLVNLNADPSMNELLVYYLKENTNVGSDQLNDIQLHGLGIMKEHCSFQLLNNEVYILPKENARTLVNGHAASQRLCLRHGDRILWGTNHFFRLNCPKLSMHQQNIMASSSGSGELVTDQSVDSNLADYSYAQEEVMLAELSDDPIKQVVQDLEKHHATEKEVALARQRQEYERKLEELKNQLVSPGGPLSFAMSSSWMPPIVGTPGDATAAASVMWTSSMASLTGGGSAIGTIMDSSGIPTLAATAAAGVLSPISNSVTCHDLQAERYAEWMQEREKLMKQSLARLREQVAKANALVREANFLSSELNKQTEYNVTLQIPSSHLSPNGKKGGVAIEPTILVKRANKPNQLWSMDKFENKIIDMREFYEEKQENLMHFNEDCQNESSELTTSATSSGASGTTTAMTSTTSTTEVTTTKTYLDATPLPPSSSSSTTLLPTACHPTPPLIPTTTSTAVVVVSDVTNSSTNVVNPTAAAHVAVLAPGFALVCSEDREDPFFDIQEDHTLIGVANMYLRCVFYDAPFKYRVPIINQQGEITGKLLMELSRVQGELPEPNLLFRNNGTASQLQSSFGPGGVPGVGSGNMMMMSTNLASSASFGSLRALNVASSGFGNKNGDETNENSNKLIESNDSLPCSRSESGYSFGSQQITIKVRIILATQLPSKLANFVFCQYHFWGEKDMAVVPPPLQPDFQRRRGDYVTYRFNHEAEYTIHVTDDLLEHLAEDALSVELYGHYTPEATSVDCFPTSSGLVQYSAGISNGAGGALLQSTSSTFMSVDDGVGGLANDSQQNREANRELRRFAERWAELYRRLEFWVAIEELNDEGNYEKVEVANATDVPCGGVYQLRHGQSRRVRVVIRPNKVHRGKGSLPLVCDSIREVYMGCIVSRPRTEDASLDSYQDNDLNFLRDCWTDAVHRRQMHLQEQLQKIVDLPGKTTGDSEREQSLMNQWKRLTDERNAVILPEPGSGIPGAPASWNPPSCMERHCPLIFLNLNVDQVTGGASNNHVSVTSTPSIHNLAAVSVNNGAGTTANNTSVGVAGLNCRLALEEETQRHQSFQKLEIIKSYESVLGAVASWDASRHNSISLNRVTQTNERVYMVVKAVVRLSHPICVDLVLRKRIAVNIYKHSYSWAGSFKKQMNKLLALDTPPVYWTGVTFQIVSSIPQASLELEERESLAQMAASQGERSVSSADNESYIEKYLRTVSALDSSLQLDRSRQEIALKEILSGLRKQRQNQQSLTSSGLLPTYFPQALNRSSVGQGGSGLTDASGFYATSVSPASLLALDKAALTMNKGAKIAGTPDIRSGVVGVSSTGAGVVAGAGGGVFGGIRKYISVPNLQGNFSLEEFNDQDDDERPNVEHQRESEIPSSISRTDSTPSPPAEPYYFFDDDAMPVEDDKSNFVYFEY